MAVPENGSERRESGTVLMIVGVILWFFDALVFFFLPAGFKLGHQRVFLTIIVADAVLGLVLIIVGSRRRAAE